MTSRWNRGVVAALVSALLFGAGTPAAKLLVGGIDPWLLAGVLYLGSGIGLAVLRLARGAQTPELRSGVPWLAGAVVAGGVIGPALLMWGLAHMPASGAALLLNTEGVFTALIAWSAFRENFDARIALGMVFIVSGAALLCWPQAAEFGNLLPALAVVGACLAWGIDNNLTRKVALAEASYIAKVKGLTAGATNVALALAAGAALPGPGVTLIAGAVDFFSYGLSLVLFVIALRHLGTARTGAYFSTAPFVGAVAAILLLNKQATLELLLAGMLMAVGVWLHVTERHEHEHSHEGFGHSHEHEHDEHHRHEHQADSPVEDRHTHWHRHEPTTHTHHHYPDAHHRHRH